MPLKSIIKAALFASLGAALVAISGCGVDDVQLNGKIFDVVGLNGSGAQAKEPKMAVRQPLVVPPGLDSLPPPGSEKGAEPSLAAIQDPDKLKKLSQADQQKQQDEYCKANYDTALARGDSSADTIVGPLGPCHPSILTAAQKWMSSGKSDADDDSQ
ncbi:MAG TPA: hypothetical protein VIF13_08390 [Hyphomicrobium sp.]